MEALKSYWTIHASWKRVFIILISFFVILNAILVFACSKISDSVKENLRVSAYQLQKEGNYPNFINFYPTNYTQLDNYTEASFLNFIYSNYDDPLKTAFLQRELTPSMEPRGVERFVASIEEYSTSKDFLRPSYILGGRTLIILLLHRLNYVQIRKLIFLIGICMLIVSTFFVAKKLGIRWATTYTLAFLCLQTLIAFNSITMGVFTFLITFISIIILIIEFNKVNAFYFMLVIGMFTAYFEWFSLSLISLGMITSVFLILDTQSANCTNFRQSFNLMFNCVIAWIIGVCFMYLGRIVCSLLVGGDTVINHFMKRLTINMGITNVNDVQNTPMYVNMIRSLVLSVGGIFPMNYLAAYWKYSPILAFILLLVSFIYVLKKIHEEYKRHHQNTVGVCICLMLVAITPLLWILIFNKFYEMHFWLAYRVLIITVFDLMSCLTIIKTHNTLAANIEKEN